MDFKKAIKQWKAEGFLEDRETFLRNKWFFWKI